MPSSDSPPARSAVAEREARRVLALLLVVFAVASVDRQVLTILIQPIKAELGASDAQLGLLVGLKLASAGAVMLRVERTMTRLGERATAMHARLARR